MLKNRFTKDCTKTVFIRVLLLLLFLNQGCSNQASTANRYLTAERLWTEKNYAASVAEFDQILKDDPNSAIAIQALYRSSMTKTLFLGQHEQALQGFKLYLERAASSEQVPTVEKEMGQIYFDKLKLYTNAIQHYELLLTKNEFSQDDRVLFRYRIARSYFLLSKIKKAIEAFEAVLKENPKGEYRYKTYLDLGHAWYALGDAEKAGYQNAILNFNKVEQEIKNKNDPYFVEAEFGLASSMEEQDQLEQAYTKFESIQKLYPAPNVVKVKMLRIEARLKKKRK